MAVQENRREKSPVERKTLQYLHEIGMSRYDFCRKTGIARGILAQDNGISGANISGFLACFPEVSVDWLLTGRGPMLRQQPDEATPSMQATFPLRSDHSVELQNILLYELDATAGSVALFADKRTCQPVDFLQIPDLPPCDGAVYVRGGSIRALALIKASVRFNTMG